MPISCGLRRIAVSDAKCKLFSLNYLVALRYYVSSCRAVLLPRFGGPEVLELHSDVEVPNLKPREVLVRARAVSVNPLDNKMRSGYGRSTFEPLLPLILGRDISGEVVALGSSVSSLSTGQEVFGALHPITARGTYTDYAILSEDEVTLKPKSLTHVEASAVPFAALTAWRALKRIARISEGQRILVVGGGGAVGFSAIQIAVATGCHVATTCGAESIDRMLAAGAEQAVDYINEDVELTIKGNFDVVFDTIGVSETERMGVNFLRPRGHYTTLQGEVVPSADKFGLAIGLRPSTSVLLRKQIDYWDSHGIGYSRTCMRPDLDGLIEIRKLCEGGKMNIPVDKTFPITQVKEAHEAKDKKIIPGKVVLEFD